MNTRAIAWVAGVSATWTLLSGVSSVFAQESLCPESGRTSGCVAVSCTPEFQDLDPQGYCGQPSGSPCRFAGWWEGRIVFSCSAPRKTEQVARPCVLGESHNQDGKLLCECRETFDSRHGGPDGGTTEVCRSVTRWDACERKELACPGRMAPTWDAVTHECGCGNGDVAAAPGAPSQWASISFSPENLLGANQAEGSWTMYQSLLVSEARIAANRVTLPRLSPEPVALPASLRRQFRSPASVVVDPPNSGSGADLGSRPIAASVSSAIAKDPNPKARALREAEQDWAELTRDIRPGNDPLFEAP